MEEEIYCVNLRLTKEDAWRLLELLREGSETIKRSDGLKDNRDFEIILETVAIAMDDAEIPHQDGTEIDGAR